MEKINLAKEDIKENLPAADATVSSKITKFKKLIKDGPFYICVVCNRCLYKRFVIQFHKDQFEHLISDMYTGVVSFDEEK